MSTTPEPWTARGFHALDGDAAHAYAVLQCVVLLKWAAALGRANTPAIEPLLASVAHLAEPYRADVVAAIESLPRAYTGLPWSAVEQPILDALCGDGAA